MKKEIILLFAINVMSAMGYSLVSPFFPELAQERGIPENITGLIITTYAVANFIVTPFYLTLLKMYGRKTIFYFSTLIEVSIAYNK